MQKYAKTKDSGAEWVGAVPAHWSVKPLFALFRERQAPNYRNKETNVLSLSYGKIIRRDVESNFGLLPESFETYNIVEPENIVLRLTDLQNDKRSLRCGFVGERGIITSAYLTLERLKGAEILPEYAFYLLHSYDMRKVFYGMGGGVRQTIKFEDVKRLPVLLPGLKEQELIVKWLTNKAVLIEKLIADKLKAIQLLKEERVAIVSKALSKGLNPKVQCKYSGISWLGDVPNHWKIKRLKHIAQIFGRIGYRGYTTEDLVPEMEGAITLSPSNMIGGKLDFTECSYIGWDKYNESPEIQLNIGDIVIVKTGSTLGKTALVTEMPHAATINPQLAIFKKIKCDNNFLFYYLSSPYIQQQVDLSNTGGTIPTMTQVAIYNYPIPLPPLAEQQAISKFIYLKTTGIDARIKREHESITKLKEYRVTLICGVVTGQIAVMN